MFTNWVKAVQLVSHNWDIYFTTTTTRPTTTYCIIRGNGAERGTFGVARNLQTNQMWFTCACVSQLHSAHPSRTHTHHSHTPDNCALLRFRNFSRIIWWQVSLPDTSMLVRLAVAVVTRWEVQYVRQMTVITMPSGFLRPPSRLELCVCVCQFAPIACTSTTIVITIICSINCATFY